MLEKIDLKGGNVSYNSFEIDLDKPLDLQEWEIREDLLQIEYGEHYFVDVGFYPSGDPTGLFTIVVIKDFDWENPLLMRRIKKEEFLIALQECIDFAAQLYKEEKNLPKV